MFATFFSVSAFASAIAVGVALPVLAFQLEFVYRRTRRHDAAQARDVPEHHVQDAPVDPPSPTELVLSA